MARPINLNVARTEKPKGVETQTVRVKGKGFTKAYSTEEWKRVLEMREEMRSRIFPANTKAAD
jgi:hypothetical protein